MDRRYRLPDPLSRDDRVWRLPRWTWLDHLLVAEAARRLGSMVAGSTTALVFANGEYNPGNIISDS